VTPPALPRVRALSIHADYRCRHSGACCTSGWDIPVEPETEERLRAALRSGALRPRARDDQIPPTALPAEPAGCLRSVVSLPYGARVVLGTDDAGRCAFFDPRRRPSGLCTVHGDLGERALPSACHHFPRVVTLTPLGVSVTLSHYCPTAAGMLFRVVPALSVVEDPSAFPPGRPYEGLDAREALPPLLRPGVLMDWPSLERWERFAVSVLSVDRRSPEAALEVLAVAAEEARRWTPVDGPFGPFFEGVLGSWQALQGALRNGLSSPGDPVGRGSPGVRAWQLVADTVPRRAAAQGRGDLFPPAPEGLGEADARWVAPAWPALAPPIRCWLAARAFASWIALQGEGLRTTVAFLRVALGLLRAEAARGSAEAARGLDRDLLHEAVRRTDLLLVHLADPEALARRLSRDETAEGPTAAW
jgi:Fe-S-cluster containining protein